MSIVVRALVLDATDNVATLIDAAHANDTCALQGERKGTLTALVDVGYGHKLCIATLAAGAEVVKYGQVIGRATQPIRVGEHAHVHNIEAVRGRGDRARG